MVVSQCSENCGKTLPCPRPQLSISNGEGSLNRCIASTLRWPPSQTLRLSLRGKLFYAGELHQEGCQLVRAANIAGAASLSATANPEALRHANRDGVVDFLVTSLDEALRILKNEIRKRQAVSVAVSAAPDAIVGEIRDRSVLRGSATAVNGWAQNLNLAEFVSHGAR